MTETAAPTTDAEIEAELLADGFQPPPICRVCGKPCIPVAGLLIRATTMRGIAGWFCPDHETPAAR